MQLLEKNGLKSEREPVIYRYMVAVKKDEIIISHLSQEYLELAE